MHRDLNTQSNKPTLCLKLITADVT